MNDALQNAADDTTIQQVILESILNKHLERCASCSVDLLTVCDELKSEYESWDIMYTLRKNPTSA